MPLKQINIAKMSPSAFIWRSVTYDCCVVDTSVFQNWRDSLWYTTIGLKMLKTYEIGLERRNVEKYSYIIKCSRNKC